MNPKLSKNNRTLDLYTRLCKGKIINKSEEAQKFGVDERSIQRDIDNIRSFLDDCAVADSTDTRKIIYDRTKKGFIMTGNESALMDNSEILAVSKILLESRAFTKKEITAILDKLVLGCVPRKNMKLVSDLIANEKYHYVELHHKSCIKDKLWEIGNEIKQYNLLEIVYYRQVDSKIPVKRVVQPVAVLFSEYYFYLNAYITEQNEQGKYIRKYDYPAIFRIDRIKSYRELVKLQFRYIGENVEAILDRLPTAKIVSEKEGESIIEAEVYGKGILMWLLSQGKMVEVLKPGSFRDEMKETLLEMLKKYD